MLIHFSTRSAIPLAAPLGMPKSLRLLSIVLSWENRSPSIHHYGPLIALVGSTHKLRFEQTEKIRIAEKGFAGVLW
jgi:hypothetical protein